MVGPSRYDGLPGGVTRGVMVVATFRGSLGVTAGPDAAIHGVDGNSSPSVVERWLAREQFSRGFYVDAPVAQGGVEAGPGPAVDGLEAQVNGSGHRPDGQYGVGRETPSRRAPTQTQEAMAMVARLRRAGAGVAVEKLRASIRHRTWGEITQKRTGLDHSKG